MTATTLAAIATGDVIAAIAIGAIICAILAACATTEKYEANLNSFVGHPEADLINLWGPPDSFYDSGGTRYLTYNRQSMEYVPGIPPAYQTNCYGYNCVTIPVGGSPGYAVNVRCKTTFRLVEGTIVGWRWEGNACRA